MSIPLMKDAFINDAETRMKLADFVLNADRLSMGEQCFTFEREFAKWHERKYGILLNSGSSANLVLIAVLKSLGILERNDKVGFSALTWPTNVMPLIQMNLNPIPIDCGIETLNVTSRELKQTLKRNKLKAVFLTNALGFCGDLYEIEDICDDKGIILLEDNCESLGTILSDGDLTGNFSLASTFSFFVGHHMSTIEGGMILTDDEDVANAARVIRSHGWDRNLDAFHQLAIRSIHGVSDFEAKYSFYELAYNIRPTEITGFLGLNQMKYLTDSILKREQNYIAARMEMEKTDSFIHQKVSHLKRISAFSIPFLCAKKNERELRRVCFEECGVETRPMIAGDITLQPFWKKYVSRQYSLPQTRFIHENGFYCANRPDLTESELATVLNLIGEKL